MRLKQNNVDTTRIIKEYKRTAQANQAAARKYAELKKIDKDYTTDEANKLTQEAET